MDEFRSRLAGAPDTLIQLELFNVADELAREALRTTPPTDVDADPATWLTSAQLIANYQTILNGTLSKMYAQTGKPWASADAAKVHGDRYAMYLDLSRAEAADSPSTIYNRILSNLRTIIPMARDATFKLEYYNIADKIRIEALRLDPLDATYTDPATYVPAPNMADAYQALLAGVLWRMYSQADKPWNNAEQAKIQFALYSDELERLRNLNSSAPTNVYTRILDDARVNLPGARDELLCLALWRVLVEFLRDSNVWREEVDFDTAAGNTIYDVSPDTSATISSLVSVVTESGRGVACTMAEPGIIVLKTEPSQTETLTATFALTPYGIANTNKFPNGVPQWIIEKYANDIVEGVTGTMMLQASKSYSNPAMGAYHARRFRDGIAQARSSQTHTNLYNAQSWAFPQQFATRKRVW